MGGRNKPEYYNAQPVLDRLNEMIAQGNSRRIGDVCDELSIFDWWPEMLSINHMKAMRGFLNLAIKLGYTGYVCFKVGASGCANGMWAHKKEGVPDEKGWVYSPDCDQIYRSFTPDYLYYAVEKDGVFYPGKDSDGDAYDSVRTQKGLEKLINYLNNKNSQPD